MKAQAPFKLSESTKAEIRKSTLPTHLKLALTRYEANRVKTIQTIGAFGEVLMVDVTPAGYGPTE